jgi:hypothetical protein
MCAGGKDTDEEEMGLVGAEADDAESEFIKKVCDKVTFCFIFIYYYLFIIQ